MVMTRLLHFDFLLLRLSLLPAQCSRSLWSDGENDLLDDADEKNLFLIEVGDVQRQW